MCACRHVIVSTAQQCSIYNIGNLNTPHIIDLKDAVSIVVQSEKHFILVDTQGVQVRPVQSSRPMRFGAGARLLRYAAIARPTCRAYAAGLHVRRSCAVQPQIPGALASRSTGGSP